jgi:hypothetical protein
LRAGFLPAALTGAAVDRSNIADIRLWAALAGLHDCLARGAERLDAEGRLAMVAERIAAHLTMAARPVPEPERLIDRQLRLLLDAHIVRPIILEAAAATLDRSVPHLVRSFTHSNTARPVPPWPFGKLASMTHSPTSASRRCSAAPRPACSGSMADLRTGR